MKMDTSMDRHADRERWRAVNWAKGKITNINLRRSNIRGILNQSSQMVDRWKWLWQWASILITKIQRYQIISTMRWINAAVNASFFMRWIKNYAFMSVKLMCFEVILKFDVESSVCVCVCVWMWCSVMSTPKTQCIWSARTKYVLNDEKSCQWAA